MIKVTYANLDGGLVQSLEALYVEGVFNPKTAYTVMKTLKCIHKERDQARELFAKIIEQHAILDANGKVQPFPEEKAAYKVQPDKKESFEKAVAEFLAIEVEIPVNKIAVNEIDKGVQITPRELAALEPLIDMGELDTTTPIQPPTAPTPIRRGKKK